MRAFLTGLVVLFLSFSLHAQSNAPTAVKIKASEKKPAILAGSKFELDIYEDSKQSDLHTSLIERKRIVILVMPTELPLVKKGSPLSEVRYDGEKYYVDNKAIVEWLQPTPPIKPTADPKPPAPETPPTNPKPSTPETSSTKPIRPTIPAPTVPTEFIPKPPKETLASKPESKSSITHEEQTKPNKEAGAAAAAGMAGLSVLVIVAIVICSLLFNLTPFIIATIRGHQSKWRYLLCLYFWDGVYSAGFGL